jgi:hypothetical protein
MGLPIRQVVLPSVLEGQSNGKVADELLAEIPGGRLLAPAAAAWNRMVAAARADGVQLEAGSTYRDLQTQVGLFIERHTLTETPGQPTSVWLGTTYWLIPGQAEAAVPGNSNHGWGLAVDVRFVDYANRLMWLVNNADRFGWSWELYETWHIHYFGGDTPLFPAQLPEDEDDDVTDEQIIRLADAITERLAPAVAREIMTYPVTTRDFDANEGAGADTTQPLAVIEGWRNTELSMLRRGIGR